jgi:hypothetical protein
MVRTRNNLKREPLEELELPPQNVTPIDRGTNANRFFFKPLGINSYLALYFNRLTQYVALLRCCQKRTGRHWLSLTTLFNSNIRTRTTASG